MSFHQPDEVRYYSFESFHGLPVVHAVFTRQGGVSPHPWSSLNLGGTVGDEPDRVRSNKTRALQAFHLTPESIYDVWQVHSADYVVANNPRLPEAEPRKADIILTNKAELTLMMRFADCVPVFLFDPEHHAIALVHAGWMGTVRRAVGAAVLAMQTHFQTKPDRLMAAIGPSIGPDHYQIGPDVITQIESVFKGEAERLLHPMDDGIYLDLWAANRFLLEQAGVRQVEVSGICTACHLDDWFSHRAEHGKTGRFGALFALKAQ